MKSIREWRIEKEGVSPQKLLELNLMTSLRNFAGGPTVKQDAGIRSGLRSKILSLWKDAQASGMSALDFVRQVWAVAGSVATGKMGGNLNIGATAKGLGGQDPQQEEWTRLSELVLKEMGEGEFEIDKSQFAKFVDSASLDIDSKLRRELKQKIKTIGEMPEYSNMSKAELFKKIVAAVAALEAEMSGSTASIASLTGKLNKPEEDIAKEVR
jgi:hypothetical protein